MTFTWFRWTGLLALVILAGCSGRGDKWTKNLPETVSATGQVTLDGKPVEGASVVFAPEDPAGYAANALTDEDGYFELRAFPSKEGAVPGSYMVQVSKTVEIENSSNGTINLGEDAAHAEGETANLMWKNDLPEKYANLKTSGITFRIPAEGSEELKIELKSR